MNTVLSNSIKKSYRLVGYTLLTLCTYIFSTMIINVFARDTLSTIHVPEAYGDTSHACSVPTSGDDDGSSRRGGDGGCL